MTQWDKIVQYQLVEEAWRVYHENNFPVQIRMIQTKRFCPKWLEVLINEINNTANIDCSRDPQIEQFKTNFFHELRAAIQEKLTKARSTQNAQGLVQTLDLQDKIQGLELHYCNNASGLFRMVKQCFEAEKSLILRNEQDNMSPVLPALIPVQPPAFSPPHRENFNIDSEILNLKMISQAIIRDLNTIQNRERIFNEHYSSDPHQQDELMETIDIVQLKATLNERVQLFSSDAHQIYAQLSIQVDKISNWLKCWMVNQRRVLNGASSNANLDLESVSSLANKVAKGLFDLYQILKFYNGNGIVDSGFLNALIQLQIWIRVRSSTLITETFIIQEQPKQILLMKGKVSQKKSETSVKVRLLVGPTFRSLASVVPVEVSLIGKSEAIKASQDTTRGYVPKIAMRLTENNKKELDANTYIADFKEIVMPKKRNVSSAFSDKASKQKNPKANKVENVPIPQRKYYFYFRSKFSCPELDLQELDIFTTSVPVIVNTHTKWKDDSWATILWDNIAAEITGNPFPANVEIGINQLIEVLSNIFRKDTGKELNARNMEFLAKKLKGCFSYHTEKVTWQMFFQQPISPVCLRPEKLLRESFPQNESPDNEDESDLESTASRSSRTVKVKQVTFHSWLYETKQLCTPSTQNKTGIPKFWKDGTIEGFICKDTLTEELQKAPGIFALYFSEALLGGLTVAWYNFEKKCLDRLSPFTPVTFVENNELERRLHDQTQLQYLYPTDQLKKFAFPFAEDDVDRMTQMQRKLAQGGYTPHCSQLRHMSLPFLK